MSSLADTLDVIRPLLPPALVTAAAFARARTAVEHLQPEITDGIYFECRLRERSPRVDLVIIVREDGGALLASAAARMFPSGQPEDRGWRTLVGFCRRWTASDSPLRELIDHIWLEYDVEASGSASSRPAPGIFCRLRRPHRAAHSARDFQHRTLSVIEALAGHPLSQVVRECLFVSVARLPLEAAVPYVGFMIGRPLPTIRICIARLPLADADSYLAATAAVGGQVVAQVANQTALPAGDDGPRYVPMLHLDIDEPRGFLRRIGIERPFPQLCQLSGETGAAERNLLGALVASGLCTRAKGEALLSWPGRSVSMMRHELGWSTVERRINHLKFVHAPGCGTETKGYLFARYYRSGNRR